MKNDKAKFKNKFKENWLLREFFEISNVIARHVIILENK